MTGTARIDHPPSPPEWLQHWPSEQQIRDAFPAGIRRYGLRLLSQERDLRLTWRADRLILQTGSQVATWRFNGTTWSRSCSCGYVNDSCAHAFAASCVFAEVCKRQGWGESAVRSPKSHSSALPPRQRPRQSVQPPAGAHPAAAPRLEVEADLHAEPQRVIVRFYLKENDRRTILRLQRLHNEARRAASSASPESAWPDADRRFLAWLAKEIQGRQDVRRNLNLLRMSQEHFAQWLDRWEDTPGRFIERASQEFLQRKGTAAARLVVELQDQGEWIQIGAVLILPNGRRRYLHEVFAGLAAGKPGTQVIEGHILEFTPPLSWELLREVFARKNPRMRRAHICAHLADLLEGRIDLVEGDCVRRRELPGAEVRLQATPQGADVMLTASVGRHPLHLDAATVSGDIVEEKGVFVITLFQGPEINAARRFLQELDPDVIDHGSYRIPGTPERLGQLRHAWKHCPDSLQLTVAATLTSLLGPAAPIRPHIQIRENHAFVDLNLHWEIAEQIVDNATLHDAVRAGSGVLRTRQGQWLAIDQESVSARLEALAQEGFRGDAALRLFRPDARDTVNRIYDHFKIQPPQRGHGALRELLAESPAPPLQLPASLGAVLRPYQRHGFAFLADRVAYGIGPILADDMGLGKTLQALALLNAMATRRTDGAFRALVICPASVVGVWLEQAAQFCPEVACQAYGGDAESRHALLDEPSWRVLVSNYAMVRIDAEHLAKLPFDIVVLDEAQQIKNPEAQITQVVKTLKTTHTLAMTGTPLENRLLDIWSIMDFLNPGFLGSKEAFVAAYEQTEGNQRLTKRIAPIMLRRTKEAVAPELPPRTEEVLRIDLAEEQQTLYDQELLRAREIVRERGPIDLLAALTRLRQICCHPQLLHKTAPPLPAAKLDSLLEMLSELLAEGHSALVFSQFTGMLDILAHHLDAAGLPWLSITGKTPTDRRSQLVEEFNHSSRNHVFLLSLRAAGTGLTLTRADYVFIYDPWWNPAVERQAIDRTHRIGQEKPVFAYRLISANTIEEKVLALQRDKAQLFADVMSDTRDSSVAARLTQEDIRRLLAG